jgi:DNA segregation ATPase FtsK/SpoIIIE, S-DNA-T family
MAGRPDSALLDSDEPLAIVVEAILRSAWLLMLVIAGVVVSALRHPVLTVATATLAIAGKEFGPFSALGVLLVLIAGAVVWRLTAPGSFARYCRPRIVELLVTPWYRLRWPRVASRTGLVAYDHDLSQRGSSAARSPRVKRVHVSPTGVRRLLLKLPYGITPAMVADKVDGIAHAMRCRDARIVDDRPGWVWLELHRRDVLADLIPPLEPTSPVDLSAIPIGRHEDGSPWALRLLGTHVLVAGATGSGKGSVLWSLLNGLAPALSSRALQVWAIDPKGGMELQPGQRLFARFEASDAESMCRLLEELVLVKDGRAKELAAQTSRTHTASPESPHILLVVDELATLTAFAERTVVRRIEQSLGILLTQGRACGISVLAAVQDPGKDGVVWRDLFPTRIAMRLDNPIQVDMVLGEGASDIGARADRISELTPGVAFVRVEGTRELRRVRASFISDSDIAGVVTQGARRSQSPSSTDQKGGEAA